MKCKFAAWPLGLLAAFLLLFVGCKKEDARLKGTIEAVQDSTQIYLTRATEDMLPQDKDALLDSALVIGGTFSFKGTTYPEGLYQIVAPERNPILVYIGGPQPAEVTIPAAGSENPITFANGMHDATLNAFYTQATAYSRKADALEADYVALQTPAEGMTPEEVATKQAEIQEAYIKLTEEFSEQANQIVIDNKNNPVSLHFLWRGISGSTSDADLTRTKKALEGWDASFDDNEDMKKLRERIAMLDKLSVGQPFIDFSAKDAEGNLKKLSETAGQGKVVLVEFWASWCRFCREANPALKDIYAEFKDKNFEIFGLSLDKEAAEWQKAVETDQLPWLQFIVSQDIKPSPAELYAVQGIPHNVLLDGEGKIVAKALHPEALRAKLTEMLGEKK